MYNYNLKIANNFSKVLQNLDFYKMIYLSSDAVYSDTKNKINEKFKTLPSSLHGLMHLNREKIFKNILKNKLIIIRPTLVYGPNDPHNGYGPNKFIRDAKKNYSLHLFGKGEEMRDHIYINDLVKIVHEIIIKNVKGVYNLASGISLTYQDTLSIIRKVINKEFEIIHEARTRLQVDQTVDISHLKQAVPELNLTPLEQGICKTFRDMEQRLSREALY